MRSRLDWSAKHVLKNGPQVELFIPCKGNELNLESNLRGFLSQNYTNYEVVFIVETERDSAVPIIQKLMASTHFKSRLAIVGTASDSGQKVHKLRIATAQMHPKTSVLAFADSDVLPDPDWLGRIVESLVSRPECVTGYRWMFPRHGTFANFFVASLNSSVAGYLGRNRRGLLWGGTWAIQRAAFERLQIRSAWQGGLSDDLIASKVIKRANLPIHYEPVCLVCSSIDYSWTSGLEFVRRQLVITRKHFPGYWFGGLTAIALTQFAFWSCVLLGTTRWLQGYADGTLFVAIGLAIYLLNLIRAMLRQRMAVLRFPSLKQQLTPAAWYDVLAFPITGPVALAIYLSSAVGSTITWRGTRYTMRQPSEKSRRGLKFEQRTATRVKMAQNPELPSQTIYNFGQIPIPTTESSEKPDAISNETSRIRAA